MNKYILKVKGMRCGMCEMHVQDEIRRNIDVKKAKASHIKGELIVICELELNEDDFHKILDKTGYEVTAYKKEEAVKGVFG